MVPQDSETYPQGVSRSLYTSGSSQVLGSCTYRAPDRQHVARGIPNCWLPCSKALRPWKTIFSSRECLEPYFPTTDQFDGRRVLHNRVSRQRQHDELSGWSRGAILTGILCTMERTIKQCAEHPRASTVLEGCITHKAPTMCSSSMLSRINKHSYLKIR